MMLVNASLHDKYTSMKYVKVSWHFSEINEIWKAIKGFDNIWDQFHWKYLLTINAFLPMTTEE